MCEPRAVSIVLDTPAHSMLVISGKDCNMYWLGDPDENSKNHAYHEYARLLRHIADAVDDWTEEE